MFDCESEELARTLQLLKLALGLELGVGGNLDGWTEVTMRAWLEDGLIGGRGKGAGKVNADVSQSLVKWLKVIGDVTGCKLRDDVRCDDAELHEFARRWAGGSGVFGEVEANMEHRSR